MSWFRSSLLLLLLCLGTAAHAANCLPETFRALELALGLKPHSVKAWAELCQTDEEGTLLKEALTVWDKTTQKPLVCIYSIIPDIKADEQPLRLDVPYLWVGFPPAELVPEGGKPEPHVALVYFTKNNARIEHNLNGDSHIEVIHNSENLFKRTFLIYSVTK